MEQVTVYEQGDAYAIEPARPEVVYVPYYDTRVAYGSWWWPAYPPVYWAPWPGYYVYPGFAFAWGTGVIVRSGFFFGGCDWRRRHVTVVNVTVVNRSGVVGQPVRSGQPVVWQHDPGHRRGVPYHIASVQQRFGSTTQGQRREFRWQDPVAPATRNSSLNRPEVHGEHLRANPRRPNDGRAGRPDGFSANPAAVSRGEARPGFRSSVGRPPVAVAPQVQPGNAPHRQGPAPQPGAAVPAGHMPQPHGFANRGQAGNHPAPAPGKAHGEGRGR
jgi:hypothetical protein